MTLTPFTTVYSKCLPLVITPSIARYFERQPTSPKIGQSKKRTQRVQIIYRDEKIFRKRPDALREYSHF
jgi:hypothetical protein